MAHPSTFFSDHTLAESTVLLLVGDKKGRFVYVNPAYLEASGYEWNELKGTIAALMVHSDTPKQVMDDMGATIRKRQPWSGIIRNQRKNGQLYWLRLNIMPLWAEGRFAGSLMVHSAASGEEIQRIDPLYRQMREGGDGRFMMRDGRVLRRTAANQLAETARSLGLNLHIWGAVAAVDAAALLCLLPLASAPTLAAAAFAALFVGFSALAALYLSRTITQPLRQAVDYANRVAACDLGIQMDSQRGDEIGNMIRALNQVTMNLRATVSDVRESAQAIQQATREVAGGTVHLSQHTESQASSLEETAASIEEMTATVGQNAMAARESTQVSTAAAAAARAGGKVVAEVIATMEDISRSGREIAEINGIIDSIAFQTNILALNAAVEAARAGEQGRGFAVVATEVRSLAQRSAKAAQEVRALIKESVERVTKGSTLAAEAGRSMNEIVAQITRVNELAENIANATQEQSGGISQINQAVSHLEQMTQKNAALVEETTGSAGDLAARASGLVGAVSVFKLSVAENQQLLENNEEAKPVSRGSQPRPALGFR